MALINRAAHAVAGKMRAIARRREGFTHDVKAGAHRLTVDEPETQGGQDMGPSPQELLAASLASCTAMTLRAYARMKEIPLEKVRVEVAHHKDRNNPVPDQFTRVIHLDGTLDDETKTRLLQIAERCPVHRTLTTGVRIETKIS